MKLKQENALDKEVLFAGLLLVHGGDPEPKLQHATSKYNIWRDKILIAIEEQGFHRDIVIEYIEWLASKKLAYSAKYVTGE